MTVSPSRLHPFVEKREARRSNDDEARSRKTAAILASSFYFHFVNEIYYYYYYYQRRLCKTRASEISLSLSLSFSRVVFVSLKEKKRKRKRKKEVGQNIVANEKIFSLLHSFIERSKRTSDRRHGRTRVSPSFVPLSPRVYIHRPIDINV